MKTYQAGLVHAAAYRTLRQFLITRLEEHDLATSDWAVLGMIEEAGTDGIRLAEIAAKLGVEPPFLSTRVHGLVQRRLVKRQDDPTDRRAKLLTLTKEGGRFVATLERSLKRQTDEFLSDISAREMTAYLATARKIASKRS